jgi:hypothetical protein
MNMRHASAVTPIKTASRSGGESRSRAAATLAATARQMVVWMPSSARLAPWSSEMTGPRNMSRTSNNR